MPTNTVYDFYQLTGSQELVSIKVTIGYAQSSTSSVTLTDLVSGVTTTLSKEQDGSFILELGSNVRLNRHELRVYSFITDVQRQFDVCSLTLVISGGAEPKSWVLHQKSEDFKTYPFLAVIGLYK